MLKKVLFIFVLAIIIAMIVINVFEEPFDVKAWKSEPMHRYKMAKDVVESQLLIGKTTHEVIGLLGESNQSNLTGKHHLLYKLGKPSSFFDENETVLVVIFKDSIVDKVVLTDK